MPDPLVADECRKILGRQRITGRAICGSPFEMEKILDFTGLRGSGSNLYYSYIYQVPKWDYYMKKVDEWMEVTPEWVEYYNLTMGQKQKLMEQIKAGLMSASQSVTDYELVSHDARRYREILDYFKAGMKDEHVIRSLFVDRVDAFTGEGYSLVTMARRWPTIITDFIRMDKEWSEVETIQAKLDVSRAEASVLKTKNELFKEWKKLFTPVLKERYARIQALSEARKQSIDAYKEWLKPYVARYKMMTEKLEKAPAEFMHSPFMTPGFGQSQALTGTKLWMWKPFTPPEFRTAEKGPLGPSGFIIDPYDDLVKEWQKKIEDQYEVKFSKDDVREIITKATQPEPEARGGKVVGGHNQGLAPHEIYYAFFEVTMILSLMRTPPPEAMETDNLMIWPVKGWFMSQNIVLIHLIELRAREIRFAREIDKLIGVKSEEEEIFKRVEKEFAPEEEERGPRLGGVSDPMKRGWRKTMNGLDFFFHLFVRRGPYETVFPERISKMFARSMGGEYKKHISHFEKKMGVG